MSLQEILARAAAGAGSLADHAHRLAGRVYAPAWEFPARESRVGELLRRQAIIIDSEDAAVLAEALQAAERATAELITSGPAAHAGLGDYPMLAPGPQPALTRASIDPPAI